MARSADIYGYTTYHNQFRAPNTGARHEYDVNTRISPISTSAENGMRDVRQTDRVMAVERGSETPSKIESFYREKTNDNQLNQFGYNLFYSSEKYQKNRVNSSNSDVHLTQPAGAVQDDYVLQVGDEVTLVFNGERKDRSTYTVASDGQLLVENFPPISVLGKRIVDVEREIQGYLSSFDYQGTVNLSVSGIRQIGVLVAGHVARPGRHNMNAFHSVIDALQLAGGIRKSGTLRQIKLIRGGKTQVIDLYGFLNNGQTLPDIQLRDGDRIIVPPIGPTFAVVNDVKQPGIFELKSDPRMVWRGGDGNRAYKISPRQALDLAGGVLSPGQNQYVLTGNNSNILNLNNNLNQSLIEDGSYLTVTRMSDNLREAVELKGHAREQGFYNIASVPTVQDLVKGGRVFGDDIYPLMGVISRFNQATYTRRVIGFSPQQAASGAQPTPLKGGDSVYLFSYRDIAEILVSDDNMSDFDNRSKANDDDIPYLVTQFVRDNVVTVNGAVADAGAWPIGAPTSIDIIFATAGGLTPKADMAKVEIANLGANGMARRQLNMLESRPRDIVVTAGDQVRVADKFEKVVEQSVKITGEVLHPGTYDLMRGDTLLTVLQRAGGITAQAYPPGAIFSRQSERRREEQRFRAAAQDLEQTVSVNLNAKDKGATLTPAQITMARDLAEDLRAVQAVGRITVEADPDVLKARPELNPLLEGGDHIHIPKRPMNVRVSGEVMNPASLLFTSEKSVNDYLAEAGGTSYYADKGRKFIVYPDGSAQPVGGWNDKPAMIIPGSTIVVPRDPKPFNFMDSFKDITQIMTNMAITGVFVEDIATDEN